MTIALDLEYFVQAKESNVLEQKLIHFDYLKQSRKCEEEQQNDIDFSSILLVECTTSVKSFMKNRRREFTSVGPMSITENILISCRPYSKMTKTKRKLSKQRRDEEKSYVQDCLFFKLIAIRCSEFRRNFTSCTGASSTKNRRTG